MPPIPQLSPLLAAAQQRPPRPVLAFEQPHASGSGVFRTVFLSDTHLGSYGARAEPLAELLSLLACRKLYLVGDIIDMWQLRRRWRWNDACDAVIARVLDLARNDTEVVFVPGNHDDAARKYVGLEIAGVKIRLRDVHRTADGRRLLVTHGDQYDLVIQHSPTLCLVGDFAYEVLLKINAVYNRLRALCGRPYWSLSQFVKLRVKSACTFISRFEETLLHEAEREGLDGVVCGHIHKPELKNGKVDYLNCGDWVESCTLVVEHFDGRLELVDGLALLAELKASRATTLEGAA
jgi:UDP-2,3-diacylglucosamine pyrophosphatase LpxH